MHLSSGTHHFSSKTLNFEYVVHSNPDTQSNSILVIQCPAWGLGSEYLQTGLAPLQTTHNHTLIFFHPRGTNGSSCASGSEMSSIHLASDLEDLRHHLGIDKFPALIGHSNGGAIVLGYAEMYPDRVEKLILLAHQLIGFKDRSGLEGCRDDDRYRDAYQQLKNGQWEDDEGFTRFVKSTLPLNFADPEIYVPVLEGAIGDRIMSAWCHRTVYTCDWNSGSQMVDDLVKVRAKTLMIFGKDDMICGLGIARRTMGDIGDVKLLEYEDCGHFPWIEQKDRTIDDIASFLAA